MQTSATSFLHQESELSHAHAQQKMTTPSRRARERAMTFHSDFRGVLERVVPDETSTSHTEKDAGMRGNYLHSIYRGSFTPP